MTGWLLLASVAVAVLTGWLAAGVLALLVASCRGRRR